MSLSSFSISGSGSSRSAVSGRSRHQVENVSTPLMKQLFEGYLFQNDSPTIDLVDDDEHANPEVIDVDMEDEPVSKKIRFVKAIDITCTQFREMTIGQARFKLGDFVSLSCEPTLGRVMFFFYGFMQERYVHLQIFEKSSETILESSGHPKEVFETTMCQDVLIDKIQGIADVKLVTEFDEVAWRRNGGTARAINALNRGLPPGGFYCQKQFEKSTGRFVNLSKLDLEAPDHNCHVCKARQDSEDELTPRLVQSKILIRGHSIGIHDGVYLTPGTFQLERIKNNVKYRVPPNPDPKRFTEYHRYSESNRMKGDNSNIPEPLQIGIVCEIRSKGAGSDAEVLIRVMYRPENTCMKSEEVDQSDLNMVFWSSDLRWIKSCRIEGKCLVVNKKQIPIDGAVWGSQGRCRFYFEKEFDLKSRTFKDLGEDSQEYSPPAESLVESNHPKMKRPPFKTLDLYSGCGGFSKGMEMSGCGQICWAIDNFPAALQSFSQNFPNAKVYCEDANSVLEKLLASNGSLSGYPEPGDVELICAGPPCQGFSGLNAFKGNAASTANNLQMSTCLSFVDYFRPKYFVMENVRNMLAHNSGKMLMTIYQALLAMQYQVTIGILQSGSYLVPQDRHRAFIVAAAPNSVLPFLPMPESVFVRAAETISVKGKSWNPNPNRMSSAPLRHVTVRSAIGDLPRIRSGSDKSPLNAYRTPPASHFQKLMRFDSGEFRSNQILDHVTRPLTNLEKVRIYLIPNRPGADWRDLPNIVWQFPDGSRTEKLKYHHANSDAKSKCYAVCPCMMSRKLKCRKSTQNHQKNTIIPWAMVHTATRNSNWNGCYGRTHWDSYFSTLTTDPDPEAKQGRVVHPDPAQNRLFSVREYARGQTFPDNFRFEGADIRDKFKQIGNAVPVFVAAAIGREFVKVNT